MRRSGKKTIRSALGCGLLLLALSHHVQAQPVEITAQRDGVVKDVSIQTPDFTGHTAGRLRWSEEIEQIGAFYIRLRLSTLQSQNAGLVTLSLRDRSGRLVRRYSGSELVNKSPLWSDVVRGGYVLVSLHADHAPEGFGLSIDQIAYQANAGAPLSTVGEDDKQSIAAYSDDATISRVQKPVAKLLFISDGSTSTCTGFLIEPGKLITNHHCVSTQEVCETTRVIFGFQHNKNSVLQFGDQYECSQLVAGDSSFELDYSVLEIAGQPETRWGLLPLDSATDPAAGDELFIVQHPAGQAKQISKINCTAGTVPVDGRATESDFIHNCDTAGGSSGSPVTDSAGNLVGLHHYGFNEGGVWTQNRAVRIKQIVEHIGE